MRPRPDQGHIDQRTHRDMDERALAHHRPEQRAATLAVHIVRRRCRRLAMDQQIVIAFDEAQAVARNAGEWLEGRTGGSPAARAVAIQRIFESIVDLVANGAAKTFAAQDTDIRLF
jgi:hypothetical protein